ncbi:unnamed protein product [Paramecium octaurelia]|uniref:Uncharacterized protein n=1 Tax=Paramecium octaurelia TaxID=43137 RepID=A0A8S1VB10_PAROT|nr:unnamed protein product [Paramecium octaurelia]
MGSNQNKEAGAKYTEQQLNENQNEIQHQRPYIHKNPSQEPNIDQQQPVQSDRERELLNQIEQASEQYENAQKRLIDKLNILCQGMDKFTEGLQEKNNVQEQLNRELEQRVEQM